DPALGVEAVRLGEETGNVTGMVLGLEALALAHLAAHEPAAATEACERALGESRLHHSGLFEEALILSVLSQAKLADGDPTDAAVAADEAMDIARRQRLRVVQSQVLITRARARRAEGSPDHAVLADLAAAQSLVREMDVLTFAPFIREEFG